MCDPILITLLKMRHHYSQSSRDKATASNGTSPLASYKEVFPPPPTPGDGKLFFWLKNSESFSSSVKKSRLYKKDSTEIFLTISDIYNSAVCEDTKNSGAAWEIKIVSTILLTFRFRNAILHVIDIYLTEEVMKGVAYSFPCTFGLSISISIPVYPRTITGYKGATKIPRFTTLAFGFKASVGC